MLRASESERLTRMKVSLYFEEEIWNRFKRRVLQRTGDLRRLSREVEGLVKGSMVEDTLKEGFDLIGIESKIVSTPQVKAVTPSAATSSAKTLKEMREGRFVKGIS